MDQSLKLGLWLSFAGAALVWARLILWRTRLSLQVIRQERRVPQDRFRHIGTRSEPATSASDYDCANAPAS